ncbi:hypothetical protein CKAH01_08065 [Colletotrichum kahawae]|uniref:F-box domain-containing protein n=1 Tax=Colletotrichum kahawae TaxID=34407 RepID=A0AAD9Y202_COLKA|nr:hypothetical protein CKAH01_08065 [Colletotrichum kahawae]
MKRPGIIFRPPSNDDNHGDGIHGDCAYVVSRYDDISDSDLLALEAAVNSNNHIGLNHHSCRSNKGTLKRSPYASPPSQLISLPAEIILEILRALPSDDKLRKVNVTPENRATLHRLPTRRTLVALSLTCRALRQLSQIQVFSEIYLTNGKPTALLLRSLIEEPHFCAYVRRLYLGFAVDHVHESRVGLRAIYRTIDVNKIPRLHRDVLEKCGIKDQWTEKDSGVAVVDSFKTFVGLILSLTTRLECLTMGFNELDTPCVEAYELSYEVLPNLRSLEVHGNVRRPGSTYTCTRIAPFPLPCLLTLPTIKKFTSYSDSSNWWRLKYLTSAAPIVLEELSLYREFKIGSDLSYLLKQCPSLKKLGIVLDYPRRGSSNSSLPHADINSISTVIPKACQNLNTLILRAKGNRLLFSEDEPDDRWLSNMTKLVNLRTEVSCLFKNPTDMAIAVLSDHLPPNLVDLALYDMWYGDSRYHATNPQSVWALGDSELLPLDKVNSITEPFAEMLLRLCSSRLAGNFPSLRKVAVQSPIFEIDTGFASNDLTKAFEAAGVRFEIIPFAQFMPASGSPAEGTQSRDMAAMDELDEIGANLSGSPSIPDCKILVRRARNVEPMLLSYIVAQVAA